MSRGGGEETDTGAGMGEASLLQCLAFSGTKSILMAHNVSVSFVIEAPGEKEKERGREWVED